MKNCAPITLLLMLCAMLAGCAFFPLRYDAAPVSGRVLDAGTGAPLEDAVVLATWKISDCCASLTGPARQRVIAVSEAKTDAEGRFRIPAWSGIDRPIGYERVAGFDPIVSVFKAGYEPMPLTNFAWQTGAPVNGPRDSTLRSIHDGTDIRLVPNSASAVAKLRSFAAVLDANAIEADEDTRLASGNAVRQRVMSMQRGSVTAVDAELRRLGAPYAWSTATTFLPGR